MSSSIVMVMSVNRLSLEVTPWCSNLAKAMILAIKYHYVKHSIVDCIVPVPDFRLVSAAKYVLFAAPFVENKMKSGLSFRTGNRRQEVEHCFHLSMNQMCINHY